MKNLTLITHHRPKMSKSRPAGQIPENRFKVWQHGVFYKDAETKSEKRVCEQNEEICQLQTCMITDVLMQ